jgi:hypothetical protein
MSRVEASRRTVDRLVDRTIGMQGGISSVEAEGTTGGGGLAGMVLNYLMPAQDT